MRGLRQLARSSIALLGRVNRRGRTMARASVPLGQLLDQLEDLRRRTDVLALCPSPTGPHWRGVLTATLALFPTSTLQLPQHYSQTSYKDFELLRLAETIVRLAFSKVILNGYPAYFANILEALRGRCELYIIYHGSLSSNREDGATAQRLREILAYQRQHTVRRIGFSKKGMAEALASITGVDARHLLLPTRLPEDVAAHELRRARPHIGVFASDLYRKNLDNQVVAALMVPGAVVHARRDYGFGYLFADDRVAYHPFLEDHRAFLALLASMDANLYVSFSETFGQVATESLALGVPCLVADNSGIFDFDESLRELLVVREFDDCHAIHQQLVRVLASTEGLAPRLRAYVALLNQKAAESLESFLGD